MFGAIADAFRRVGRDPQVRCILLAGQGRHFTAGLDLEYASRQFGPASDPGRAAEGAAAPHRMAAGRRSTRWSRRACRWWPRCTAPASGAAST
jgi:enoyl-CoA hydratase/carnithine racemase